MKQKVQANKRQQTILKADLCVACGMCLPHCPTYQIAQTESESPRGRLSLILALLKSDIEPDLSLQEYLNHCLLCRSCETCCPANVPFAEIMDEAREHLTATELPIDFYKRLLLAVINRKRFLRYLVIVLQFTGIRKLLLSMPFKRVSKSSQYIYFLGQMDFSRKRKPVYKEKNKSRHSVALFTGCVHEYFDGATIENAINVLNHFDVDVIIPERQSCCGAMHLHSGRPFQAGLYTDNNRQVFEAQDVDAVVSLASACTVTLVEAEKKQVDSNVNYMDILSYLDTLEWDDHVKLNPVNKKILLHYPCTQRNGLKNTDITERVLGRIPGLSVNKLTDTVKCCGAAGSYSLDYPEFSLQLKALMNNNIEDEDFDILVTSNVGCAIQFRSMRPKGVELTVLHPIDLLAQALARN